MNINEKMEQKKSDLLKVFYESDSKTKEQVIQELLEIGLKHDYAKEMIDAFRVMEGDKKTEQRTWETAWNSKSGVDFSTDIGKAGDRAARSARYFEVIRAKYALRLVIEDIGPNEINDELLEKINEEEIRENEINNPALRVAFKYYTQFKTTEEEKRRLSGILEGERQKNSRISRENETLKEENEGLKGQIRTLKDRFTKRLKEMNASYKKATAQITTLKERLEKVQNKKLGSIIREKISTILGKKVEQLPELEELPREIITNAEVMGVATFEDGLESPSKFHTPDGHSFFRMGEDLTH